MRTPQNLRAATFLAAIFLCTTVVAAGCGNKNKRPDGDLVSDKDPVRGFLATIPADTPYAFVAAEPMPMGPILSWMDGWMTSMEGLLPDPDQILADEYVSKEMKLAYALIGELSGNYNAEGFKKLGLSVSPRFAFYGIGFLPAMRMDIDDPEKFKAMVDRVESKSGYTSRDESLGNTDFWSYDTDSGFMVMAVKNRQVLWGYTERETAEVYTTYLLGETLPANSMATDDRITPLAQKHGFKRFGAGFVDFQRIAQIVLEPGDSIHDQIFALLGPESREPVPPECLSDSKRLVNTVPRMVFGYEEWTGTQARFGIGLELTNDVGRRLNEARTNAPLVGSEAANRAPVMMAFGFDVSKVLDVFNNEMLALQQKPFMCTWYNELNDIATEATAATAWVPAMITNLRGGAVIVENVRQNDTAPPTMPPDGSMNPDPLAPTGPPVKVEGLAVVNSTAPAALLAYLRTLAPEFENVTPDPGGIPMPLPPSEQLQLFDDPHVVLTQSSLALISGAGSADESARLVTAQPTESPFAVMAYDFNRLMEMVVGPTGPQSELLQGLAIGRTEVTLDPREAGVFMHFDMDLPAPPPR